MFSTMPSTGTSTFWNMLSPLRASSSAMSCGVETITAPASGTCCASVSCASPVPGGMSTTMMSSSPHSTSRSICCKRARHHRPAPDHRRVLGHEEAHRHAFEPVILHRDQGLAVARPRAGRRSRACAASRARRCRRRAPRPRSPLARKPSARLAATVDLPTPPLPEATATIAPTPGTAPRACERRAAPGRGGAGVRRAGAAAGRRLRGQHRRHRKHPRELLHGLFRRLAQRLEPRAALALDLDRKGDIAVADDEPRDHSERDDVGALVGIRHPAQRIEDLSFGDGAHFILPAGAADSTAAAPIVALGSERRLRQTGEPSEPVAWCVAKDLFHPS